MSEHENQTPTNLDLHIEQTKQSVMLEQVCKDVRDIKELLVGNGKRDGVVFDVDRLKRSHSMMKAIVWVLFTTFIGAAATIAVAAVAGK